MDVVGGPGADVVAAPQKIPEPVLPRAVTDHRVRPLERPGAADDRPCLAWPTAHRRFGHLPRPCAGHRDYRLRPVPWA